MYRLTVDGVETYMVVTRNVFSHRLTVHRKYDLKVKGCVSQLCGCSPPGAGKGRDSNCYIMGKPEHRRHGQAALELMMSNSCGPKAV